jgi:hypothetical protein
MTKRIAKKRTALSVAYGFSVPFALAHARPSFYALPRRERRVPLRWAHGNSA